MENTSCFSLSIWGSAGFGWGHSHDQLFCFFQLYDFGSFVFSDFDDLLTCCCLAFDAEKKLCYLAGTFLELLPLLLAVHLAPQLSFRRSFLRRTQGSSPRCPSANLVDRVHPLMLSYIYQGGALGTPVADWWPPQL
jgi:hypothetical protein